MHKLLFALTGALLLVAAPARAQATGEVGSVIVWRDVTLLNGRTLKAAELNGKPVVVQIWASWCPFCGAQNPHVQKLHDAYANRGLTVLAFSIDRTEQAAKNYLAKHGYTFNVAMRSADADRWFGHPAVPNIRRRPKGKVVSCIAVRCFPRTSRAVALRSEVNRREFCRCCSCRLGGDADRIA